MKRKKLSPSKKQTVFQKFKKEFLTHKSIYILLVSLLVIATFLRGFRTNVVLGFYFVQGRDALVLADLLQRGK